MTSRIAHSPAVAARPQPVDGPWAQTASGRAFALCAPRPSMLDLRRDVAEPLARLPRFAGQTPSGPYSIAQHSVIGAHAIFRETGRADLALWFALHDAQESIINDWPTPATQAVAQIMDEHFPQAGSMPAGAMFLTALRLLKTRLDDCIHRLAGAPWPVPPEAAAVIHAMDIRMLRLERDHLMVVPPQPWHPAVETARPIRITGRLRAWPWPDAADKWLECLERYAPARAARAQPIPQRRAAE